MPYGKGTYGSKKGRPSKAAKAKAKKKMTDAQKKKLKMTLGRIDRSSMTASEKATAKTNARTKIQRRG